MGKLPLKDKVCVLVSWAAMWTCCAAQREYFPLSRNLTWDEARSYCQECFKDLVTLTAENTQTIVRNLTSEYWVGLRKNLSSTSVFWSGWANEDPLVFQNWYPGWPVFKPSIPKTDCCSCSCTCPVTQSTTSSTEFMTYNVTPVSSFTDHSVPNSSGGTHGGPMYSTAGPMQPVEAACVRSTMVPPDVPDTDENYIEDSCVAMLGFGPWVERNCSDLLPFICYDDAFLSPASVANVTTNSADLTWLAAPGNISHYRLVVTGGIAVAVNVTDLSYSLVDLTAGTLYWVQVFPVKCERDLHPQEVAFNTTPNKVENLKVTNVTNTSVSLSWTKPAGNVDFYRIDYKDMQIQVKAENNTVSTEVKYLIPGSCYTFSVTSRVEPRTSEESNITTYTQPGTVSNLTVSNVANTSMVLNWERPTGSFVGFRVTAMNDMKVILFNQTVTKMEVEVEPLPVGSKISLSVAALAGNGLEGQKVTVINYTAPGPISNLILVPTHDSLTATWTSPVGNYTSFSVELQLNGKTVNTSRVTEPTMYFNGLMTAANYTVTVCTVSGQLKSPPVGSSKFTLPLPPTHAKVSSSNNHEITIAWEAPANAAAANYSVQIRSIFWGHTWTQTVENTTTYTFSNLSSGTRYDFEVRTVANKTSSDPLSASLFTGADKRELSLSMLCSSAQPLLCDNTSTRASVFLQLQAHFRKHLGDGIFWELKQSGN